MCAIAIDCSSALWVILLLLTARERHMGDEEDLPAPDIDPNTGKPSDPSHGVVREVELRSKRQPSLTSIHLTTEKPYVDATERTTRHARRASARISFGTRNSPPPPWRQSHVGLVRSFVGSVELSPL